MKIQKTKTFLNYYLLSKYTYVTIKRFPKILSMSYNIILTYKQKNKFFIFLHIIIMLIFYNPSTKTRFLFKTHQMNILEINFKSEKSIFFFIHNFIYIYFPRIDSFSAELKFFSQKNIVSFSFFKLPLIFELNSLFNSIEYLYNFINSYKFQLNFILKKQKNNIINFCFLQYLKFPILLI